MNERCYQELFNQLHPEHLEAADYGERFMAWAVGATLRCDRCGELFDLGVVDIEELDHELQYKPVICFGCLDKIEEKLEGTDEYWRWENQYRPTIPLRRVG